MPYLICDKCGGYYELQDGESIDDFFDCECGGKFKYVEIIEGLNLKSNDKLSLTNKSKIINWMRNLPNGLNKKAILISLVFGLAFGLIWHFIDIKLSILSIGAIIAISGALSGYISGKKSKIGMKNGFIGSLGFPIIFTLNISFSILIDPETYNGGAPMWRIFALLIGLIFAIIIISGLIGSAGGLIGSSINKFENYLVNQRKKKNTEINELMAWWREQNKNIKIGTTLVCLIWLSLFVLWGGILFWTIFS